MNNFIKIIPARAGHCTANYNLLFSPGMTDFVSLKTSRFDKAFINKAVTGFSKGYWTRNYFIYSP